MTFTGGFGHVWGHLWLLPLWKEVLLASRGMGPGMLLNPHRVQDIPMESDLLPRSAVLSGRDPALIIGKILRLVPAHTRHQSKSPGVRGYKPGPPRCLWVTLPPSAVCAYFYYVQHPRTSVVRCLQNTETPGGVPWGVILPPASGYTGQRPGMLLNSAVNRTSPCHTHARAHTHTAKNDLIPDSNSGENPS